MESQDLSSGLPSRECPLCWEVGDEPDPRSHQTTAVPELCQLTQRKLEEGMKDKSLVSLLTGRDLEYRVASPSPLTPCSDVEACPSPKPLSP